MITPQLLSDFRKDFDALKKNLESKYGIIIDIGRITYESDRFHTKLEAQEFDPACPYLSKDAQHAYRRAMDRDKANLAYNYGFDINWIGKKFNYKGKQYEVVGSDRRNRIGEVVVAMDTTNNTSMLHTPIFYFTSSIVSQLYQIDKGVSYGYIMSSVCSTNR